MSIRSEDITAEAMKEYEKLIAITGIGYLLEENAATGNEFHCMGENGKIILSNKRKSSGKLGTIITEHWMLFPEEIEEAIKSALDSEITNALPSTKFSLHTFEDLCVTLEYKNPSAQQEMQAISTEKLTASLTKYLTATGCDEKLSFRFFF